MLDIVCFVPCPWSMNVHKAFEDYVNLWYVENWMCLLEALWKHTPTPSFWSQTRNAKKYGTQHIVQNICISRHENLPKAYTTFHVGYIVCWCLKKEMLTMCFDIRCRKTYILSHSHSFLRKKLTIYYGRYLHDIRLHNHNENRLCAEKMKGWSTW